MSLSLFLRKCSHYPLVVNPSFLPSLMGVSVTSLSGNNSTCVGWSLFLGPLLICHCIPPSLVHLEMNLTLCLGVLQRQSGNSEYVCRSSSDRAGVYLGTWVVCFAEEGRPVCTGQLVKVWAMVSKLGAPPRKYAAGVPPRRTPEVACGWGLGGEGCPQTHSKTIELTMWLRAEENTYCHRRYKPDGLILPTTPSNKEAGDEPHVPRSFC